MSVSERKLKESHTFWPQSLRRNAPRWSRGAVSWFHGPFEGISGNTIRQIGQWRCCDTKCNRINPPWQSGGPALAVQSSEGGRPVLSCLYVCWKTVIKFARQMLPKFNLSLAPCMRLFIRLTESEINICTGNYRYAHVRPRTLSWQIDIFASAGLPRASDGRCCTFLAFNGKSKSEEQSPPPNSFARPSIHSHVARGVHNRIAFNKTRRTEEPINYAVLGNRTIYWFARKIWIGDLIQWSECNWIGHCDSILWTRQDFVSHPKLSFSEISPWKNVIRDFGFDSISFGDAVIIINFYATHPTIRQKFISTRRDSFTALESSSRWEIAHFVIIITECS